jgi:flotillin
MEFNSTIIFIALGAIMVFGTIVGYFKRLRKCSADELLVIWGSGTKGKGSKIIHGGMEFVWPGIQDYKYMNLTPIPIGIELEGALSKQNIRVNVPSNFMVAIDPTPEVAQMAAQRLLNLNRQQIAKLAEEIIYGQLREVIATMDIEEINSNREKFQQQIQIKVESELKNIGLKLVNVNITDITDQSNYIKSLGEEAASDAVNKARVSVAQKNKEGDIGFAQNEQERKIKVAELLAQSEIGEAEADTKKRIKTSEANSRGVEGENTARIEIARTNSLREVEEAEAKRLSVTAQQVKQARTQKDSYEAIKQAELERAAKEEATLKANVIVPAEIAKQELIIQSEATAEQSRQLAKGEADGIFYKMEANAKGVKEMLVKQAEGFDKLVQAAGGDPAVAIQMMITDKLPEMLKIQADAFKEIEIDKITVWENGGGSGEGNSSTGNFLNGLLGSMPQYKELFEMAGAGVPQLLESSQERTEGQLNAKKDEGETPTNDTPQIEG